jgi:hypothetical protein
MVVSDKPIIREQATMIPRAKLTNEIFGNPLKNRVSACRKRVRYHRGVHRPAREAEPAEVGESKTAQFPADSGAVRQLLSLDLSPAIEDMYDDDGQESIRQEVGVT